MCKRKTWFVCNQCEEIELLLDPCDVNDEDNIICDDCFEQQAIEENDDISLMICRMFKTYESSLKAKQRPIKRN